MKFIKRQIPMQPNPMNSEDVDTRIRFAIGQGRLAAAMKAKEVTAQRMLSDTSREMSNFIR